MEEIVEQKQFIAAYDEFADSIFRHCYFRVSDREIAKDLAQETFTKTWDYLVRGGTIQNIKAFLYRTAHNLIIDHYRRKKTDSLDALMEDGFEPKDVGESPLQYSERKEVIAVLEQMDSEYRNVLTMRYLEELSPKEIAEITGEKENTISVRIHRGLKKLKEQFDSPPQHS